MNIRDSWLLVVAILTVGLLGCEKKAEPPSAPPTNSPTGSVSEAFKSVADTASNELKKVVEEVKTTAGKTLTEVTQQAQNLTSGATAQAQEYIDKARAFVSQQKYQDALAALKGLGNVSLSPEQQKAVDDLKQAIQKALGSGAVTNPANAATNLPGN